MQKTFNHPREHVGSGDDGISSCGVLDELNCTEMPGNWRDRYFLLHMKRSQPEGQPIGDIIIDAIDTLTN